MEVVAEEEVVVVVKVRVMEMGRVMGQDMVVEAGLDMEVEEEKVEAAEAVVVEEEVVVVVAAAAVVVGMALAMAVDRVMGLDMEEERMRVTHEQGQSSVLCLGSNLLSLAFVC